MRTFDEEYRHRRDLRKKYFEDPRYLRWSDVVHGGINGSSYTEWRDDRLFDYLITNQVFKVSRLSTLQTHLQNGHKLPINWSNFYAYFDAQLNDPDNPFVKELTNIFIFDISEHSEKDVTVEKLLNRYRDELYRPYDMI